MKCIRWNLVLRGGRGGRLYGELQQDKASGSNGRDHSFLVSYAALLIGRVNN